MIGKAMTSNEQAATMLIICLILAILGIMCGGCGRGDDLRGHNINMTVDAVQCVKKTLQEEQPRIYEEHKTLARDIDDALDRLALAQRDFPAPRAEIKRSTPEEPSAKDENLYCAYAGLVDRKDAKRKARAERWGWLDRLWWWTKVFLWAAPFVGILLLILWVRREFFHRDKANVKLIQLAVPDKDKRREIAAGTVYDRVYHRIKHMLGMNGKSKNETAQDSTTSTDSTYAALEDQPGDIMHDS